MSFKDLKLRIKLCLARRSFKRRIKNRGKNEGPQGGFKINYEVCKEFKSKYRFADKWIKINELFRLSQIKIPNDIPYKKRRKSKHPARGLLCWICSEWASVHHHIIQIINGGYDNGINRIPVCEACHEKIHPHLMKDCEERYGRTS